MLIVDNITVFSGAGLQVCTGLSLQLKPGMCLGILGANGSGKTTLLHTVAGFIAPTTGSIMLDNNNIFKMQAKSRARKIACLLQSQEFNFPFSVLETVTLAKYSHISRFALLATDDTKQINATLQTTGLFYKKSQDVRSLSGGEKQRLALASIFVQDPDFFLLDEPTNNLDLSYLKLIKQIGRCKNKASIMVLHDLTLVQNICTHVLMLKSGEFLFGTTHNILNKKNLEWVYQTKLREFVVGKYKFYPG